MPRIYELPGHVADLIAAGEVVERPASVVKELLENAIDAGAGIVTVEIQGGGMTYIRVTDNGCGVSPEDAQTAFLRHATSKLRNAEGLEAIGTLGFRGEALAAIAAVSRIELLSREPGAHEGVSLSLAAGTVTDISPAGCPEGTTMIVRDLFFNTPARLKFMKSDRAEGSAISAAVARCALSRPDVSIRFIKDGKTELHTPGDSRADSCIYSLFGREFSAGLISAESSFDAVSVTGFVSSPAAARGNRSYQFFFVNGRTIQSKTLQAALEQAYSNTLPSGRYPSCALYITLNHASVDVNVHPAKTEVKFFSDKQVFDCVYYAALGAVNNAECRMQNAVNNAECRMQNAELGNGKTGMPRLQGSGLKVQESGGYYQGSGVRGQRPGDGGYNNNSPLSTFHFPLHESAPFRVIGEALNTYIVAEHQDSVWFIDKHAAHERIHFDALSRPETEQMSQTLITPIICRHGQEDVSMLLENAEFLEELGFLVESFGDGAVAVRGIPAEIELSDAEPALSEICAQLSLGGKPSHLHRDAIYRTLACKAAIKAGKSSDIKELEALAERVFSGEAAQCPHGRPVAFEVTRSTLEKSMKRQ